MITVAVPYREPLAAFSLFAEDLNAAFLDWSGEAPCEGITLLAAEPIATVTATELGGFIDGVHHASNPFTSLCEVWRRRSTRASGSSFTGALIGYLGYELGKFIEKLPPPKPDSPRIPAMYFGIYDTAAFFDRKRRLAWVASADARKGARLVERLADAPVDLPPPPAKPAVSWVAEQSRTEAESNIQKIIEYIRAGDIFQANYTQRFVALRPGGLSSFDIYRRLRSISPAPYSTFLKCGDISIVSASPERFLAIDGEGLVTAQPIKGTRRRDSDPILDAKLAKELRESAKDNAENLMIVDLMRNDLSRVCEAGTVKVPYLNNLQSFEHVHHLVSTVTGRLLDACSPVDVLRATFPGGSVTGAPKIRAMEIIRELEPSPRGAYCGAHGWIGFDGKADLAMTIRTLTLTPDIIMAQAGAGIVADSDPASEYEETMIKVAPLLRAGDMGSE